ncbi:MAG: hypothetical protein ACI8P3_001705 [Saprospiraceae bacterium]
MSNSIDLNDENRRRGTTNKIILLSRKEGLKVWNLFLEKLVDNVHVKRNPLCSYNRESGLSHHII